MKKFSEWSTEFKAMAGFSVLIISGFLFMHATFASKEALNQHLADNRCDKATDNWVKWDNRKEQSPKSREVSEEEKRARKIMEQQCSKKG